MDFLVGTVATHLFVYGLAFAGSGFAIFLLRVGGASHVLLHVLGLYWFWRVGILAEHPWVLPVGVVTGLYGVFVWLVGHWTHARRTGRWASRVAYRVWAPILYRRRPARPQAQVWS